MKKYGKLSINTEKVIKNEVLVNLRGGYGGSGTNCCLCIADAGQGRDLGYIVGVSYWECLGEDCSIPFPGYDATPEWQC